ncbi:putative mediator of RNA polymerase II transcription subunit 15 isoform X2 [Cylas formicarius]|uniref:putative mediator of RNA polymerase II transcription subunit 15 isoform X2 n=1 Tax=Cylas formicarius TaxID=197179 RepID=UPI002958C2A6|nr:putative mediator of RNA polymerase II transcription subunit 15 isoform X2 [Cylas formicarius]
MSDLIEEFLNDDNDADYPDLGEADEDALLQDDEETDILELAVEDELGETLDDSKPGENEEEKSERQDKFATERKLITAPDPYSESLKPSNDARPFHKSNYQKGGSGQGNSKEWRGVRGSYNSYGQQQYQQYQNQSEPVSDNYNRNKTVLINPRFQGVVTVDNGPWNNLPQQQQQWAPHVAPHFNQPAPLMHIQPQPLYHPHIQPQGPQAPYWHDQSQPYPPYNQHPNHFHSNDRAVYMQQPQPPPPGNFDYQQSPMQYQNYCDYDGPRSEQGFNNMQFPPRYQNRAPFNYIDQQNQFSMQKRKGGGNFVQSKRRVFNNEEQFAHSHPMNRNLSYSNYAPRPTVVKEVTVNIVTNIQHEESEDPQTRDLRQKIEEQRRKRVEVLRWKENRRKQFNQRDNMQVFTAVNQQNLTPVPTVVDVQQVHTAKTFTKNNQSPNILLTNGRRLTLHQKKSIAKLKAEKIDNDMSDQRIVNVKPEQVDTEEEVEPKKDLSNFLADHRVVVKDESLLNTRAVFIKNISTSTTNKKILTICRTMGDVQRPS